MEPAIEPRVRKSHRTITLIRRLLRLFEQSNIKSLEFCKQHDIDKSTFYKWKSRYGSRVVEKKQEPLGFAKVEIPLSLVAPALFAEVAVHPDLSTRNSILSQGTITMSGILNLGDQRRYHIYRKETDMRKRFDSLCCIVRNELVRTL